MTKLIACASAFALGIGLAGLAFAAPAKDTYRVTANLKPRSEVPRPKGVPAGATGLFTGTAVEIANDRARVTWRLTFSHLSGRALQAHIHAGRAGKSGNVLAALCSPCRSGQRGTATITHAQLRALRSGATYVNVHTKKNAAGEVRGQLKASKIGDSGDDSSSSSSSTVTTTTTDDDPYP